MEAIQHPTPTAVVCSAVPSRPVAQVSSIIPDNTSEHTEREASASSFSSLPTYIYSGGRRDQYNPALGRAHALQC